MNYDTEPTYNVAGAGPANEMLSFSPVAPAEQRRFSQDELVETVETDVRASPEELEEFKPYIGSAEYLG